MIKVNEFCAVCRLDSLDLGMVGRSMSRRVGADGCSC
jgi:hypothetical protein